jgi:hypothetical protein
MAAWLWSARPDLRAWCTRLIDRGWRWRPHPSLLVDRDAIATEVERAAAAAEPWLAHPSLNALTRDDANHRHERDIRFVTWVAAHAASPPGSVTLDRPSWRWSPRGEAVRVPAGHHNLAGFHARDAAVDDPRARFAIDLYCRSLGFPLARAWAEPLDAHGDVPSLAAMAVREITQALNALVQRLPECAAWASSVTRVIVPLQHEGTERSSGSQPDIPGLIHVAGLHGPVAALEALVHESAHHHCTMLEAAGPWVDPDHREMYTSPLRPDPRPLGRVLLAVHALWHMVAFYDDGMETGLLDPAWSDRRNRLAQQLAAGLETIERAEPHLTETGRALVAGSYRAVRVDIVPDVDRISPRHVIEDKIGRRQEDAVSQRVGDLGEMPHVAKDFRHEVRE